jgi:hypothetical protein
MVLQIGGWLWGYKFVEESKMCYEMVQRAMELGRFLAYMTHNNNNKNKTP